MADGGNVLVLCHEGGAEQKDAAAPNQSASTNAHINRFISQFGIVANDDNVVRTVYHKDYFHPKARTHARARARTGRPRLCPSFSSSLLSLLISTPLTTYHAIERELSPFSCP
jgi:hypothetical protein